MPRRRGNPRQKSFLSWAEVNRYPLLYLQQHAIAVDALLQRPRMTTWQHVTRLDCTTEEGVQKALSPLLLMGAYDVYSGNEAVSFKQWETTRRYTYRSMKHHQELPFQDWFSQQAANHHYSETVFAWLFSLKWMSWEEQMLADQQD